MYKSCKTVCEGRVSAAMAAWMHQWAVVRVVGFDDEGVTLRVEAEPERGGGQMGRYIL